MKVKDLTTAASNRQAIAIIKRLYGIGAVNREEAKLLAQPILDRINQTGAEVAKKYGKNPIKIDFVSAMRNSY